MIRGMFAPFEKLPSPYGQSFISGRLVRWERLEHFRDRLLGRVAGLVRIGRGCIGSDTAPQRLFALRIEDVHQERSWLVLHRRSGSRAWAIFPRPSSPSAVERLVRSGLRPLPRASRPRPVLRLAEHRPILGRPSPFRCPNVFAYPWSRCRTTSPAGRRTCGSATASMPARRLRADWCRTNSRQSRASQDQLLRNVSGSCRPPAGINVAQEHVTCRAQAFL